MSRLTVEQMVRQCAQSMTGTFSKQEITSWFRRHYPDVKESTLSAHIQALTSNAPNRERNHPHLASHVPVFDRVGYGLYRVHVPGRAAAVPTLASEPSIPMPLPEGRPLSSPAAPAAPASPTAREEWFWEGNVQSTVVGFLLGEGWRITRVADTATKEHGTDVEATREGRRLHLEAKGWPSATYADPSRAHEKKKTLPATQARVWFSDAVVHALRLRATHPDDVVTLAFPAHGPYRRLWEGIREPVLAVRVAVLWVKADGTVDTDGWGHRSAAEAPRCSRCGGEADFLVTAEYEPGVAGPGRLLVYCRRCRDEFISHLSTSLPMSCLAQDPHRVITTLYATGATQSDPVIAADLILRDPLASWIAEVTRTRALREGAHGEA